MCRADEVLSEGVLLMWAWSHQGCNALDPWGWQSLSCLGEAQKEGKALVLTVCASMRLSTVCSCLFSEDCICAPTASVCLLRWANSSVVRNKALLSCRRNCSIRVSTGSPDPNSNAHLSFFHSISAPSQIKSLLCGHGSCE